MMDMSKERRLIFFDIDGTLITEDGRHMVPDSTTLALEQLRRRGHLCLINTGRPYAALDEQILGIKVDGYVCGCGTNIRLGDQVLLSNWIDAPLCAQIVRELDACGLDWLLEGEEMLYYADRPYATRLGQQIDSMRRRLSRTMQPISPAAYDRVRFAKFIMVLPEGKDARRIFDLFGKELSFIDRGGRMYEVVPKPFSKATGIQFLEEHFGIPHENTIAVGDSANDVSMLEYAGVGILMGGTDPALRRYADLVTAPISEDGIFLAFRQLGLI